MKSIKRLEIGLFLSLAIFLGVAKVQSVSANLPGGNISCADAPAGCKGAASCGEGGTLSHCTLQCESGGTVHCGG